MYLSALSIRNFCQFGDLTPGFVIHFNEGVTALVGENDASNTAVIDAIRYVLQTRDSNFRALNSKSSMSRGIANLRPTSPRFARCPDYPRWSSEPLLST
ncbi:AAA family ATPase [Pseudomonas sp. GD03858]|uniref:AAA family ATPase n=1 Tax=unclassified Pseudomonas TaxID=196821 RepID=UPI00244AAA75|nr:MULTISPECIES: AAA family ATPase [unclassified Pseudomonas]MDH0646889.1 AAA family ATPase [Pseudomonas sp. GD03867]MDH0663791.1 AAA family ATPase [Pseudomonas sp. GD03858]